MRINITNVQQQNKRLFSAQVQVEEYNEIDKYTVRTNNDGEGLWIDEKQVEGTCQFSAITKDSFRAKVRRFFSYSPQ